MEPMVIKVHGVPSIPPHDRMVDQLKIHFLKRRNSGGDVLTVIYPTSTPGQAYVIFESAKVPGVLERTHVLDVDSRFYPIHVEKAHLSEVDMPVETMLDLSMFSKPESVLKILKDYEFNVTEPIPGRFQLKGSFLKLKLIRNELICLQRHERQSHSRAPSTLHNGSTLGYAMDRDNVDLRFVSKSVSRNVDKMDAVSRHPLPDSAPSLSSGGFPRSLQSSHSSYTERNASSPVEPVVQKYRRQNSKELLAQRRSPLADDTSSLTANSPSSFTLTHDTSNRDSASGGSPKSLNGSYYSFVGSTSHKGDTMQHHTSYKDSVSRGSPSSLHGSYYPSVGITSHTGDTMQHDMSYQDSASHGSPRSLHDTYSSSVGSTSHTGDIMRHHTSYRDSASVGSLRRRSSFNGDTYSSPSSSSGGKVVFPVDTDSLYFILSKQQDIVKVIEECYHTEMVLKDNVGFTMVTFSGKNSEEAKTYLLDTIKKLSSSLRTQEIHLKNYDRAEKKQIFERIERNKNSGVMITHNDDVVKLVGSSKGSFEMMQKILGNNDDPHRGRTMERSSKIRRSTSLPRQYKLADHAHNADHKNQTSVANKYSPSRYQEEPTEGKAPQIVRGPEQTPNKNSQRTGSNSESQGKNRTTKELSIHQDVELVSSSREKKSPKSPMQQITDVRKRRDLNFAFMDIKLRLKKKNSKPNKPD